MGWWLGVDIGTTYVAAAVADDDRVEAVTLGTSATTEPAVVLARRDGTVLVGEAAVRRAPTEPTAVAREAKRRFGDPVPLMLDGVPWSADLLTAHVLRNIVDRVAGERGSWPDGLGLTHPANWGDYKLELLAQVVERAGLGFLPTTNVPEPEAAALDHAERRRVGAGEVVAVYDLGGGTFDVAVFRRTADGPGGAGFELLGPPQGIERLGGIDFDAAVLAHVDAALDGAVTALAAAAGDGGDDEAAAAVADLRRACVEAKEQLSSDTDAAIRAVLPGRPSTVVRITRGELEAMIAAPVAETVEVTRRALAAAGVAPAAVHAVLLVGGSSRIPLVAEAVTGGLGRPVLVDAHPKLAVARGAAIAARRAGRGAQGGPGVTAAAPVEEPAAPAAPPAWGTPVTLEPVPSASPSARRRLVGAGVAVAVALAGAGAAIGVSRSGGDGDDPAGGTPTTEAAGTGTLVEDRDDLWFDGGVQLAAVGLRPGDDGGVEALTVALPDVAGRPLVLTDEVWLPGDDGLPFVQRVDRSTGDALERILLTRPPGEVERPPRLVPAAGGVWALTHTANVTIVDLIDPATGEVTPMAELEGVLTIGEAAVADGADLLLGIADPDASLTTVHRVGADGVVDVAATTVDGADVSLAVDGDGTPWLAHDAGIDRLDPETLTASASQNIAFTNFGLLPWEVVDDGLVLVVEVDDAVELAVVAPGADAVELVSVDGVSTAGFFRSSTVIDGELWIANDGALLENDERVPPELYRVELDGSTEMFELPTGLGMIAFGAVDDRPTVVYVPQGLGVEAAHVVDPGTGDVEVLALEAFPYRLGVLDGSPVVGELRPAGRVLGLGEDGQLTELAADLPRIQTPVPVGDELWLQAGASVVVIGPGGAIEIFDPEGGGRVVAGDGALLVGTAEERTLFDPARRTPLAPVPGNSGTIAFTVPSIVSLEALGLGAAWDIGSSSIIRTDLATGVRQEVALAAPGIDVVIGPDTVWVGTGDGRILRLDPATGALIEDVDVLTGNVAVHLVGPDATPWAVDPGGGDIARVGISDAGLFVDETFEGNGFATAAVVGEELWVVSSVDGTLRRFDADGEVGDPVDIGGRPANPVPDGAGGAWVLRHGTGEVVHLDPSGAVDRELDIPD